MVANPELAKEVVADPAKFQERYSLSPRVMEVLGQLRLEDFEGPLEDDALDLAAGGQYSQEEQFEDGGCYYGG